MIDIGIFNNCFICQIAFNLFIGFVILISVIVNCMLWIFGSRKSNKDIRFILFPGAILINFVSVLGFVMIIGNELSK